jgi:UDPglucose--hexose-1-phosphate uridylyltransferase
VVIAPERSQRPHATRSADHRPPSADGCLFCPGREDQTPPAVWSLDAPDGDWRVKVVPNRFAILSADGRPRRHTDTEGFVTMPGIGRHEVIVESRDHWADLARADPRNVRDVLEAYRARYRALRATGASLILIFRNHGLGAGTSLTHPHSQIVAAPVVPVQIRHRFEVAIQHHDDLGTNLYTDVLERELRDGRRILVQSVRFVAFQPFASAAPYETWIMPRSSQPSFDHASDSDLDDLAPVLRSVLASLAEELDDPDYNAVLQSAPVGDEQREYFVWHLRILPRLSVTAGFELGSGMAVNPWRPEDTTARLRPLAQRALSQGHTR